MTVEECINLVKNELHLSDAWLIDNGIIGTDEICNQYSEVDKRRLSRILHILLIKHFNEADEDDWSSAYRLKDLFDCHTCVAHIAQIYTKGIMDEFSDGVFGINEPVLQDECILYLQRCKDISLRNTRDKYLQSDIRFCKYEDCEHWMSTSHEESFFIASNLRNDVIRNHPNSKILSLSIEEIIINPYVISNDRNIRIYLFENSDYQGSKIAKLLIKSGYTDVWVIIQ